MVLMIKFSDVQAALSKCLTAHPAATNGGQLCSDAQRLSELYGLMAMSSAAVCPISQMTQEQKAALERWTT